MEDEILVKATNVSKKFCRDLKKSLWYGVQDITSELLGKKYEHTLRDDEFWSLDDVSFEIKRGECLGLIGPNGAGKSTLLKILTGLIKPDKGRVEMRGRVGALIELGTGFNPILTGRENIYSNGTILGFSRAYIDQKLDEIIAFSEVEEFIDSPVKHYSSGMKVRLGFSVAAHLDPDILIIDEVLAVGDVGFRAKCYNHMANMLKKSSVILVSHSIPHIDRYSDKIMLLNKGKVEAISNQNATINNGDVIEKYYSLFQKESSSVISIENTQLQSFEILNEQNQPISEINHNALLRLRLKALVNQNIKHPIIDIAFLNRELQIVGNCKSSPYSITNHNGCIEKVIDIYPFNLNKGTYKISLLIFDEKEHKHLLWCHANWEIAVTGIEMKYGGAAVYFNGEWKS